MEYNLTAWPAGVSRPTFTQRQIQAVVGRQPRWSAVITSNAMPPTKEIPKINGGATGMTLARRAECSAFTTRIYLETVALTG